MAYTGDAGPELTIPVWGISREDGQAVESYLGAGGSVVTVDAQGRRAGENLAGDVLLYTPTTYSDGSSLGHWDSSAAPALLMEPVINPHLSRDLDLTPAALQDIGWSPPVGLSIGATKLDPGGPLPRTEAELHHPGGEPGPGAATGVAIDVTTDASLAFDSASPDCAGGFPCILGDLAPGEIRTVIATWSFSGRTPRELTQTFRIVAGTPAAAERNAAITVSATPPSGCGTVAGPPGDVLAVILGVLGLAAVRRRG